MDIIAALLCIAGYGFNAVMDILSFRRAESIFDWVDEYSFFGRMSWTRKYKHTPYKDDFFPAPNDWYYRTFDIAYREKFPLSTTALVFLTDGWHFAQWMMYNCFALAPAILTDNPVIWFLVIRICGGLLFTFLYNQGLEK